MNRKTEGIVLRSRDYGEGNSIITIFSRDYGKISVMARGAKKPKSRLSSVSQPFTHAHYLFFQTHSSSMGTLSQGEIIQSFKLLRTDLTKTAYAAYFTELFDKIVDENDRSPVLFPLLLHSLQYLDQGKDVEILARLFEMKMLMLGGYRPQVDQCLSCKKEEGYYFFSVAEGGLLCEDCYAKDSQAIPMQPATLKIIRLLYHMDLIRLGNISVQQERKNEIRQVIWSFMDYHTPLRLKSRSFLEQLSKFM